MTKKKVLILKNDRGGDLLNSISCISTLLTKNNEVTIYLSNFNFGFNFLFKNANIKKINYDLNLIDKLVIFFHILINKYDEVFILTPKNYYYYLPLFFKKIKFFGITVDGVKRNRPKKYLKNLLYKYVTINRKKINDKSSSELQNELVKNDYKLDKFLLNISKPELKKFIQENIPNKFIFIQYKDNFYDKINLSGKNFSYFLNLIRGNDNIIFSSDIELSPTNTFFYENYRVIDCEKNILKNCNYEKNITYLHNIDSENLFALIGKSQKIISPHGLITHMCKFYNKSSINLFNFKIRNSDELKHQKIAFSEWYKNMNIKFLFLNNNINRTIKKINKNL